MKCHVICVMLPCKKKDDDNAVTYMLICKQAVE